MNNALARYRVRARSLLRSSRSARGASMVEYMIVVGVVACVCIAAATTFGDAVKSKILEEQGKVSKVATG